MFEVGFSEIVLILGLALLVLGPEKLPGLAEKVGRWTGRARAMARQLRTQLEQEVTMEELAKSKPMHAPKSEPAPPPPEDPLPMTEPEPIGHSGPPHVDYGADPDFTLDPSASQHSPVAEPVVEAPAVKVETKIAQ